MDSNNFQFKKTDYPDFSNLPTPRQQLVQAIKSWDKDDKSSHDQLVSVMRYSYLDVEDITAEIISESGISPEKLQELLSFAEDRIKALKMQEFFKLLIK
jgi:hypothetical protein